MDEEAPLIARSINTDLFSALAAVALGVTDTVWPDVVVGLAIAALFLHSAWQVFNEAMVAWRGALLPNAKNFHDSRDDYCPGKEALKISAS